MVRSDGWQQRKLEKVFLLFVGLPYADAVAISQKTA